MDKRHSCTSPQLVIGLLVLSLGVLFLLNNLGYADAHDWFRFWPVIIVALGAVKLFHARHAGAALGASFWILAGTWLLLNKLNIVKLEFWRALLLYWPLLLVGVGLSIVWRTFRRRDDVKDAKAFSAFESARSLRTFQVFGGTKRAIGSSDFKGGEITTIFGGVNLDLSRAQIAPSQDGAPEAVLELLVMWGGVELRVPEGWVIDVRVSPILGGIEDRTRPSADPRAPRLVLQGNIIMGGVEVKN
jgi:hypothetical protein